MTIAKKPVKQDLAQKVAERIRFLEKVTGFAVSITRGRGNQLRYSPGSRNTHRVHDLQNFHGFTFHLASAEPHVGGNTLLVWRHCPRTGDIGLPVLNMYWEDSVAECEVYQYDTRRPWEEEMLSVIRRRKTLEREFARAEAANAIREQKQDAESEQAERVRRQAKNLLML